MRVCDEVVAHDAGTTNIVVMVDDRRGERDELFACITIKHYNGIHHQRFLNKMDGGGGGDMILFYK